MTNRQEVAAGSSDPDFDVEVVAGLYRYQRKRVPVAAALAVFAGIFGAHRFYLNRSLTGVLMLMTGGGGLFWWIWDLFRLRAMVDAFNNEEEARADARQPPQGLGFLPPQDELKLSGPPAWADKRNSRAQIVGSAIVLGIVGYLMGSISGATGIYEPVVIIVVFVAVTLTAGRWKAMSHLPVLGGLSRWNHRLRLYYHTVDPGSVWLLALRPFVGVLIAPWRARARVEVRLYLQLGAAFALIFALLDIAELGEAGSVGAGVGLMLAEIVQTLFYTYVFVAPAGALLTTQLLLSQRDQVVWVLSVLTIVCVYFGLVSVGAV